MRIIANNLLSISVAGLLIANGAITNTVYAEEAPSLDVLDNTSTLIKRKSIIIVKKRTEKPDAKGIKLGNFILLPSVAVTEYYDDNVYASDTAKKDDFISVLLPSLNLNSTWQEHALALNTGFEVTRYTKLSAENSNNAWLNMSGRYDFNRQHNLFAGIGYIRDHEDRASPDAAAGDSPTEFYNTSANIGYSAIKNNNQVKLAYTINNLDFDDVNSTGGIIDNDDRDREEQAVGLKYLYKYSSTKALFINAALDNIDYIQTPDSEGNDRNSSGFRYAAGIEVVTKNTVSKFFVGQLSRNYKSTVFEDIEEFDFGLEHNLKFNSVNSLVIKVMRSIEETTLNTSPGYLLTDSLLRLSFPLADKKTLNFELRASQAKYFVITRADDYLDYTVSYSQKLLDNLQLSLDAQHSERDSSITGQDYKVNQLFFRIKAAM